MKKVMRSAIVEHSTREIYALVEDIEAYPKFLPWCAGSQVIERVPGRTVATLKVGFKGIRQSFTTENANRDGESIEMRLVKGPFKKFSARWRFEPLAARAARIEFTLEYEIANRVLAKLLDPVFDHIADTMVHAFTRRADEFYGEAAR
jgi:ribosome-associated toxin RatA of RatAB toxin-antitoxin module